MDTPPDQNSDSNQSAGANQNGHAWLDPKLALGTVLAGLIAVIAIAIAAIIALAVAGELDGQIGTVATGAFGVVGTIVGAYFGIHLGTKAGEQGKAEANAAANVARRVAYASRREEADAKARAIVMASHLPEGKAAEVNKECQIHGAAAAQRVTDAWHQAGDLPGL
jgi:hypothetical protein